MQLLLPFAVLLVLVLLQVVSALASNWYRRVTVVGAPYGPGLAAVHLRNAPIAMFKGLKEKLEAERAAEGTPSPVAPPLLQADVDSTSAPSSPPEQRHAALVEQRPSSPSASSSLSAAIGQHALPDADSIGSGEASSAKSSQPADELAATMLRLERENLELRTSRDGLISEHGALQDELERLRAHATTLAADNQQLRVLLERSAAAYSECQRECAQLSRTVATLTDECAALNELHSQRAESERHAGAVVAEAHDAATQCDTDPSTGYQRESSEQAWAAAQAEILRLQTALRDAAEDHTLAMRRQQQKVIDLQRTLQLELNRQSVSPDSALASGSRDSAEWPAAAVSGAVAPVAARNSAQTPVSRGPLQSSMESCGAVDINMPYLKYIVLKYMVANDSEVRRDAAAAAIMTTAVVTRVTRWLAALRVRAGDILGERARGDAAIHSERARHGARGTVGAGTHCAAAPRACMPHLMVRANWPVSARQRSWFGNWTAPARPLNYNDLK